MCRLRPELFNHFLSLRQDLWLKLELIYWKSPVSASLYWVTSLFHKAQLSKVAGGLFSDPHTCTDFTHWAISLTKIISFPVLSHNTWNDQLKKRKGCLSTQFQRFQPMVSWTHCVWVYGEAAQWQKHIAEEVANHMVGTKQREEERSPGSWINKTFPWAPYPEDSLTYIQCQDGAWACKEML